MPRPSTRITRHAIAAAGALAIAAAGVAAPLLPTAQARGRATMISLRSSSRGRILVAPNGHTLFAFSRDGRRRDRCAATRGCTGVWPIAADHGRLRAGRGVRASLLGTIAVHGVRQLTYAGRPLYTYSGDVAPASTSYVGVSQFGGRWSALDGAGRLVR